VPLYEYQCDACGKRFEVIQKSYSDPAPDACRVCGNGPVHRLMSSPAIQFKGSGFYITDYAKKGSADGGSSPGKTGETKGETAAKSDTASSGDTSAKTDSSSKTQAPGSPAASSPSTPATNAKE
jgi:putative FmdB family regulatory protein